MSRFLWGDFIYVSSHDFSLRISFPRSIAASITGLYSAGAGIIPDSNRRHRSESLSMIVMYVDVILAFAWVRWYSVKIRFTGQDAFR